MLAGVDLADADNVFGHFVMPIVSVARQRNSTEHIYKLEKRQRSCVHRYYFIRGDTLLVAYYHFHVIYLALATADEVH